jgi:cation diffusion facilitator CzcD-associated flavoprotein CzcO
MDDKAKFAIVGAGPVGLAIAKALKQHNIPYVEFEADSELGGNWLHGVYETAHIISSRKTTEYADYPMPVDYPDFPSAQQMLSYLQSFAQTFDLRPNIEFNSKVTSVTPREDELWNVQLNGKDWRVFKGVVVCNGHHWDRRFPDYPGKFDGEFIHSKDYKSPTQLINKKVLVIGGGNSACDIASEAARVGSLCAISIRRGYWFLPKTIFGIPLAEAPIGWMPISMQRTLLKAILRVVVGDYGQYGLPKPDHQIFEKHPTINSEILHYLKHGRIKAYPDIAKFDGKRVVFVDGRSEIFDTVVCATGFHVSFPFLPKGLVPVKNHVAQVYGGCALPDAKNLYVVGTGQPRYGFGPLVTPASELVAKIIELQDKMVLPVGRVLKEVGDSPPATCLIDPHAAMRELNRANKAIHLILFAEKRLRKKIAPEETRPQLQVAQECMSSEVRVY